MESVSPSHPGPIGTSPDARRPPLLTGAGRFLDDLKRDGLLHLGVVRALHAHARVRGIAAAEAAALPGVLSVLGPADLPEAGRPLPSPYGSHSRARPHAQPVLARERVASTWESTVAVVVAEDPYRVADALEAVTVDYEPLRACPHRGRVPSTGRRGSTTAGPNNVGVVVRGATGDV